MFFTVLNLTQNVGEEKGCYAVRQKILTHIWARRGRAIVSTLFATDPAACCLHGRSEACSACRFTLAQLLLFATLCVFSLVTEAHQLIVFNCKAIERQKERERKCSNIYHAIYKTQKCNCKALQGVGFIFRRH